MPPFLIEDLDTLKELAGQEIGTSNWFTVTQERIQNFAEATEDRQWIHLDRDRALRESPYGTTIAHGFLTLSLIGHLMRQAIEIRSGVRMTVNYGLNRVRFPFPVRADSRIRARVKLLTIKGVLNAFEAVYSITIENEGADKPCCVAEYVVRYYV
jgi:acyl dehydratase